MPMDTERVQCPECQKRFDMDQDASSATCPHCKCSLVVMRSEHARALVTSETSGGDGTGCVVVVLIVLAIYLITTGQPP